MFKLFKQDFEGNKAFLSIITTSMPLLNEYILQDFHQIQT